MFSLITTVGSYIGGYHTAPSNLCIIRRDSYMYMQLVIEDLLPAHVQSGMGKRPGFNPMLC